MGFIKSELFYNNFAINTFGQQCHQTLSFKLFWKNKNCKQPAGCREEQLFLEAAEADWVKA